MQNRKRDTDVQNRLLDSVREGEGGMFQENSIETCTLSRVKQITSPDWMHETSARAWCTGKTQSEPFKYKPLYFSQEWALKLETEIQEQLQGLFRSSKSVNCLRPMTRSVSENKMCFFLLQYTFLPRPSYLPMKMYYFFHRF